MEHLAFPLTCDKGFCQSYHIFDSSLTRVKSTVKVISTFDLAFDKNQMCHKSNFSCRASIDSELSKELSKGVGGNEQNAK